MAYRVIQWGTGAMGRNCLREVLAHPGLELVGALVHSESKHGRDAGEIVRRPAAGVDATMNFDDILATEADVVIHAARINPPYTSHDDEILRLLASGKNVISINGRAFPQHWGADHMARIEEAGRAGGGTTLFGTGLNPGFAMEKMAMTASSICLDIENVAVSEVADANEVQASAYVFDVLGFGSDPDAIDPNDPNWPVAQPLNGMYSELVAFAADRLGFELDSIRTDHKMFPATQDLVVAAGEIPKGKVSHTRWRWHAVCGGADKVTMTIHWLMERAHLDDPEHPLWKINITGKPNVDIDIELSKPKNDPQRTSAEQYAVAASVINAIPAVCAAPPGVLVMPSLYARRNDWWSGAANT